MKILISHVYSSNNNGDAAILSAQIAELKRVFDNPQINILTIDTIKTGYTFDGIAVTNALMYGSVSPYNNKLKKLILAVLMMSYTSFWSVVYRFLHLSLPLPAAWKKPMELLVNSDMEVSVGGGHLRAREDSISTILLMMLFHQIWLAKILRKPVYLYAQSFGPYPRKFQYWMASHGLAQAELIMVREAKSLAMLKSMGLVDNKVVKVPDSAFLFAPAPVLNLRQMLKIANDEQVVGITARSWLSGQKQLDYEQSLANLIKYICSTKGFRVVVIAQVTSEQQNDDDRLVGRRIAKLLPPLENVTFLDQRFSHTEIKSVFAGLNYLVGTRFHSVIFALTAGIPALAIEYEHKTSGIMQDLGLEQWVINIEDVDTAKLKSMFDDLVTQRDSYTAHLAEVLPTYIAKAGKPAELIKLNFEQSQDS